MRYLFGSIFIISLLFAGHNAFAQTALERSKDLGKQAVVMEDRGDFNDAIRLLTQAEELDPSSAVFPYEMANSYYNIKEYQKAIDILTKLTTHRDVFAKVYQLLCNAYDDAGQTDKAIEICNAGLKVFPKAGELYLELAEIQIEKKDYTKALDFCEDGIKADPMFPSNYYWAAHLYCNSTERVWGIIYGEVFMNIERNTKRTAEISKLLFDTYKDAITITSPTKANVNFSRQDTVIVDAKTNVEAVKIPFNVAYGLPVTTSVMGEKSIDLESLNRIRTKFLNSYRQLDYDKKYPNILYEYQDEIVKSGNFEAYNYWLLREGNEAAFTAWRKNNKEKWDKFLTWYNLNPIKINDNNKFYRGRY